MSGLNFSYIQNLISAEDSTGLCEYFEPVASEISQYIHWKYGEDIIEEYDTTMPLPTMVLSLLLFSKENGFILEDSILVDPLSRIDPAACFFNILGDLVGYHVIVQLYNDFVNGATATTIWKALKQLVRRVFAGIAIALAIYHLGDCLDWW